MRALTLVACLALGLLSGCKETPEPSPNYREYAYVSNGGSNNVSVIDTESNRVVRTIDVGSNPNDMKLAADGRLFVACSNDNTIHVIDTNTLEVVERLSTTLTPFAPEGSTPDAIEIDNKRKLLYVANADNNSIAVIRIAVRGHSAQFSSTR